MVDWYKSLKEQGDLAKSIASKVTVVLEDEGLSLEQAGKLYGLVAKSAQTFENFSSEMAEHEVDDALLDAADALDDMWSDLVVAIANRMRRIQGLEPIEVPDELED